MSTERVTAAANAISEYSGMRFDGFWSRVEDLEPEDRKHALAEASAALEAADSVMFNGEAVDRAAQAICAAEFPEVSPTYAWKVQFEDGQNHYRQLARAALAAVTRQAGQS